MNIFGFFPILTPFLGLKMGFCDENVSKGAQKGQNRVKRVVLDKKRCFCIQKQVKTAIICNYDNCFCPHTRIFMHKYGILWYFGGRVLEIDGGVQHTIVGYAYTYHPTQGTRT